MKKVPTYEEIKEYRRKIISSEITLDRGVEYSAMYSVFTERIFSVGVPEGDAEVIWKFCKKFAGCSHCPVTPKEYKRMEDFAAAPALVDILLKAMDGYYRPEQYNQPNCPRFDVVGYYYAAALLSQSGYRRGDCLALLDRAVDYEIANLSNKGALLLRNMKVLVKDYPDLAPMLDKLEKA